ncbi:hypothetical protein K432DRAFT_83982 [Lepidopterella palustris CBS 459.81]|uniref:Secreted protein n=1 Tax=Lepidopterella palustris CBS 459.81 TaxID=1314670 RepID=A0A8E2JDQ1_9PEZI|nr:hypothetical protein K432DRAFT_83982 [Lepidopterella palustris CBS 459.81]
MIRHYSLTWLFCATATIGECLLSTMGPLLNSPAIDCRSELIGHHGAGWNAGHFLLERPVLRWPIRQNAKRLVLPSGAEILHRGEGIRTRRQSGVVRRSLPAVHN